jgi:hypothetical protein
MLFSFIPALLFMIITPFATTMMSAFVSNNYKQVVFEISHLNKLSCIMLMYLLGLKTMKRLHQLLTR